MESLPNRHGVSAREGVTPFALPPRRPAFVFTFIWDGVQQFTNTLLHLSAGKSADVLVCATCRGSPFRVLKTGVGMSTTWPKRRAVVRVHKVSCTAAITFQLINISTSSDPMCCLVILCRIAYYGPCTEKPVSRHHSERQRICAICSKFWSQVTI